MRSSLNINDHAHIYNRGVDKRVTFNDSADYARFIHTLYVCNDPEYKSINLKRSLGENIQNPILNIKKLNNRISNNRLVDILCLVLMPNHYHLLLKQNMENGISKFMQRIGIAYTNFFNLKNERTGALFQGKYRYKIVISEEQLLYLSKYIHLNPISIIDPNWKENGVSNWKEVNTFLENYKWSSYQDYVGIKNFPSIINPGLLEYYYNNSGEYKKFINNYLVEDFGKFEALF